MESKTLDGDVKVLVENKIKNTTEEKIWTLAYRDGCNWKDIVDIINKKAKGAGLNDKSLRSISIVIGDRHMDA